MLSGITLEVPDNYEYLRKLGAFGSHFSMVYGDHTLEINELTDLMDLAVVYATRFFFKVSLGKKLIIRFHVMQR